MTVLVTLGILIIIMLALTLAFLLLTTKVSYSRNKFSTFECGMDLMSNLRLPFSLHFYFVSIVFLIFDVELMLILPFIYCLKMVGINNVLVMVSLLILILILGFLYEWWTGLLNWMI